MTLDTFREARLRDSREFELVCSEGGVVLELDERGQRLLGECVGRPLRAIAVPDTEAKLDAVFAFPAATPESGWEVSLLASGRPVTAALRATRQADRVFLLGSLLPEEHARILMHMNETIGELADRQRETERQKRELLRLNRELSESNRGLLSLHAELDEKSDMLRRAADVKGRVVANVSHEFRTPLNSILGLSSLLLDRVDGELTPEQEKQLRFIRHSAASLSELVNDLLDLSKLEAGKLMIRPRRFEIQELFAALRGMMRPLLSNTNVELVVESGANLPTMETDEGKISQILRNLVSNAVKFTESGTIKVGARATSDGRVEFFVEDTGIGIAAENLDRIFDEFSQIDSALQRQVKGTGLGLALSRKLAEVLGGTLKAESELGKGSVFRLRVPVLHEEVEVLAELTQRSQKLDPRRAPILVVEDDRQTLFLYEKYLKNSGFQVIPARSIDDARQALERVKPAAIVLDVMLEGEATWGFLSELKESAETHEIPVMVVTVVDRAQKARALGADEFWLKPVDGQRLIRKLNELSTRTPGAVRILVIDDDDAARYLIRKLLERTNYVILEAKSGPEGVELARRERPHVIFLDFVLGDITAFDVLDELKVNPTTRGIPVIIQTAKTLDESERERLRRETAAILSKQSLNREVAIGRVREALLKAGSGATLIREGVGDA